MQKKKLIGAGIGVVVVIAVILGGVALHKDSEAVETMAEVTPTAIEEDSSKATEEPETVETEPPAEETTDAEETGENTVETEQETDVLQEDEHKQEKAGQDIAEISEDEGEEEIDAYMYTTADLNMRKKGTTESEVIGSIPYGTEIHVTARTADNWYRTERGEIGYVSGKYLSDTKPEQNTSSQQTASAGDATASQPSNGESSVPGISQSQMDKINEVTAGITPYTGPTSEMFWTGGGGHHLNE